MGLVKYPDFDVVEDKYMAISLNYRGEIKSKVANATVQWVKTQGKVSFVEWCPTGFKIGLNDIPAKCHHDWKQHCCEPCLQRTSEQEVRHDVLPEGLRALVRWGRYGRRWILRSSRGPWLLGKGLPGCCQRASFRRRRRRGVLNTPPKKDTSLSRLCVAHSCIKVAPHTGFFSYIACVCSKRTSVVDLFF